MSKFQKTFIGKVVSSKMSGVLVVKVTTSKMHPLYKKSIKWTKKYHVKNDIGATLEDVVEFIETKPVSRTVRWKTLKILNTPVSKSSKEPVTKELPIKPKISKPVKTKTAKKVVTK